MDFLSYALIFVGFILIFWGIYQLGYSNGYSKRSDEEFQKGPFG